MSSVYRMLSHGKIRGSRALVGARNSAKDCDRLGAYATAGHFPKDHFRPDICRYHRCSELGLGPDFRLRHPVRRPSPRSSSPDVYLITIDTLRADHVGCYGYKQVETPALDALAADGVRFSQAFTHSPITNTSHITILTGLLPSVHGVTDFGVPLSPQHVTAAELLKKRGYQTAAFIGAVILDSNTLAPASIAASISTIISRQD